MSRGPSRVARLANRQKQGRPPAATTRRKDDQRVFFGTAPLAIAENDYASRLATWREWQPVSELAQGPTH